MRNSFSFKSIYIKNSYLLIIAAWLITFSFIIDNYWSGNSSVSDVCKKIEKDIQQQELDFEKLLQDTVLIKNIDANNFDANQLNRLTGKPYFIFRYFVNDIGLHQVIFWNTQTVLPTPEILTAEGRTGFIKLDNGYYVWQKKNTASSITVALIPVKWNYFVTNTYLQNTFVSGQEIERKYDIAEIHLWRFIVLPRRKDRECGTQK